MITPAHEGLSGPQPYHCGQRPCVDGAPNGLIVDMELTPADNLAAAEMVCEPDIHDPHARAAAISVFASPC